MAVARNIRNRATYSNIGRNITSVRSVSQMTNKIRRSSGKTSGGSGG